MSSQDSVISTRPAPAVAHESVVHVAIMDDRPAVARGLAISLVADDLWVEERAAVEAWIDRPGRKVALVGRWQGIGQTELVSHLRSRGGSALGIVVLLADVSIDEHRRMLLAGADGVVDQHASLEYIGEVVRATVNGHVLLPSSVATAMLLCDESELPRIRCEDREVRWLQALVDGATVSDLAKLEGYSEREMYRLLNLLYSRLGADSRTRAIVRAAQRGLVT